MDIKYIKPEEANNIRRVMPKSKVMQEYEGYLKQLPDGQVGKIEITQKDDVKPYTVRNRLIKASRSLKLEIETKRVASSMRKCNTWGYKGVTLSVYGETI